MNLKLLEKLVRLANNNPNENESNLAARKVCRIIEEGKFKFVQDVVAVKPQYPFQPSRAQEDFVNKKTTSSDAKRPFSRSSNPFDAADFNFDFADIFNKYQQSQQPKPRWKEKTASGQARDSQTYTYTEYARKGGKNSRREKRPLNCKRCGEEFLTGFVGPPQMFTCNTCYWVIHQEQEAKRNDYK